MLGLRSLLVLAALATGCLGGTLPGGVQEPPLPSEFAFTFDVRVTEAFAGRMAPLSLPDNGSCVSVNSNDTQIIGGHARATWIANTPSTQTLALGIFAPNDPGHQRTVNGTAPLDIDLNATHVTKDTAFLVYVGVPSGTGVAVQQDAKLRLNFTYSGLEPHVVNATCKVALGN